MKNDWKKYRLNELGVVRRGKSRHRPRNDKSLYGGEYPFIQTSDVKNAEFYISKYSQTYNESGLSQSKLWPSNTLCITIAANIAENAILKIPACFPDSIIGFLVDSKKSDIRFVKYAIDNVKREMQLISKGTTQDNLSVDKLLTIPILAPPVEDQKKIASVLSAYDDLIENNNRRIAILEEMAQSIYKEWFVDFKFPEHEKVKIKNGIPEGWEEKEVLDIHYFKFCKSKIKEFEGEKEYFATANINGMGIVKEGEKVTFQNKPSRAQIQPVVNTAWFARMKDSFKVLAYRKINVELVDNHILSSGMLGFEAEEDFFGFLYFTINSIWFHDLKDQYATGATQVSLTNEGLAKIKILSPEEVLVKKYSKIVNPFIDQILILQQVNNNLRKTREILLPKLMSGEINI